jgi:hypothetical protein
MPELLQIPIELVHFQLPNGVQERLASLLDRQDAGEPLTQAERQEAEGLVELDALFASLQARAFNGEL